MTMPAKGNGRLLWAVSVLALALIARGHAVDAQSRDTDLRSLARQVRSLPGPSAVEVRAKAAFSSRSSKIQHSLLQLADEFGARGERGLASKAAELSVPVEGRDVTVKLVATAEDELDALERQVRQAGGRIVADFENTLYAEVPADRLEGFDDSRALFHMSSPGTIRELQQALGRPAPLSEGVGASRVRELHDRGITGKGVKVGIVDFGYRGIKSLISSGRLPQPKGVKAVSAPDFYIEEAVTTRHGTACAEIVHDMAPDAELYLALIGDGRGRAGPQDVVNALQWLADQKVDIISYSGGGQLGRHDGNDAQDRLVDQLTAKGILFVAAAGNEGDSHWRGPAVDRDRDGFIDVLDGNQDTGGVLFAAGGNGIEVIVEWDDWGSNPQLPSATQDIDLQLWTLVNGHFKKVGQSENQQQGVGEPLEFLRGPAQPGQIFAVRLVAKSVSRPINVRVVIDGAAEMLPVNQAGSIGIPATARTALAVGAVEVSKGQLEPYSSHGPTDDNRLKPEVVAPTVVKTMAYRSTQDPDGRFNGTSAAAPHVSGFAALIKQAGARQNVEQLRRTVIAAVRGIGTPVPNNAYGYGHIDGSTIRVGFTGVTLPAPPAAGGGASAAGIGVELPEELGGAVSTRTLERLWEMAVDRGEDPDVRVVVGQREYRVGDGMRIGFRSEVDCYYSLIHRSAEGQFTVIAPAGGESRRLRGGERYALPANDRDTITVTEPIGREALLLVCAPEEIDLADAVGNTRRQNLRLSIAEYSVVR